MATTNRSFRAKSDIVSEGNVEATGVLKSTQSQVNEGGEIQLSLPSSGSTLSSGVNIDIYQNKLRIFEAGGTNRGAYIDLSAATGGVGSDLLAGGGGGATTLDGLSDVTITSITDNEILQYDSGTSSWINQTISEAGLVSGVGTAKISYQTTAPTSPTTGDIWIDSDATTSTINLDDIGDVTITSNTSGELLSWNGSAWINQTTAELNLLTTSSLPEEPANADAAKDFGYVGIPQVSTSTGLNLTASHAGKHIYTTATGQTHTIPANSSVPLEIGTTFVFINAASVSTSIAITTDTLLLAGAGTTGTRTLAAHGMATAVKITSTSWIISGTGLT